MRTIRFKAESAVVDALDALAKALQRDRTFILNEAISHYLALQEKRDRETLEAIEECDQGLEVPHEDVMAWVESLGTDHPLPMPVAPKLLEQQEKTNQEKFAWLKAGIAEGIASDVAEDSDLVFDQIEERIKTRARAKEKLAWLKAAIAEGLASGFEDSKTVYAEMDALMNSLDGKAKAGDLTQS